MIAKLTIKIPYDLARYAVTQRHLVTKYETNQVIKALDTWLVLKAAAPGSYIQHWNDQKKELTAICKVSETIFRHRLKVLQSLQLLQYDRHHIRLCSWRTVESLLYIDCSKKLSIQYEISNPQTVSQWLIAAEIMDNQCRQAYMITKKLDKNPGTKEILQAAIIKAGGKPDRLNDPEYFIKWLFVLYLEDFRQVSEIHDILKHIRPDTNRGVKKMAATWNAKHKMTVSYWKSVLQKAGIIDISKLQIQSDSCTRNEFCHVIWLNTKNIKRNFPERKALQTLLVLCDQISVLQPWLIQNLAAAA